MRLGFVALALLGMPFVVWTGRAADPEPAPRGLRPLVQLLGGVDDPAVQRDVLRGMQGALQGRRQVAMPAGWAAVYQKLTKSPRAEVRERAVALAVLFGDQEALASLRKTLMDSKAAPGTRQNALQTLLDKKDPELVPLLQALVADRALRGPALRGLAVYNHKDTPAVILRHYASFTDNEKSDAIQTLASRPAYALALLAAIRRGTAPRRDVSAFTARQLLALKDQRINEQLTKVWGTIRPASQEKAALMAKYRALLTPDSLKAADPSEGRLVFSRTCASCHRLFGEGAAIGPELTGSQRATLDYVLENVLDPSALVAKDYQMTIIETKDGRIITGIIKRETDRAVTIQTQNESVLLPKNEIEARTRSAVSMMPEGLLDKLKKEEVRDLVAYLASPAQVPLPKAPSKRR